MKEYAICEPEELRQACIDKGWFTAGSNEQYEKLFFMNEYGDATDALAVMTTIIWTCSDVPASGRSWLKIETTLSEIHMDYRKRLEKEATEDAENKTDGEILQSITGAGHAQGFDT